MNLKPKNLYTLSNYFFWGMDMRTRSLCPECLNVIDAEVVEENAKVVIKKDCPEDGHFEDIYWGNAEFFKRVMSFDGYSASVDSPHTSEERGCPYDCGLCPNHKSMTILANIDVTNRCNQRCPICFANAAAQGYIYEPSKEQIFKMLENLRNQRPVPCPAIQFSGGEPTVREDLPELIRYAEELDFPQIQIATNGVRLAKEPELIRRLYDAGLCTIYLQFDGITEEPYIAARGYNALPLKLKVIENLRMVGIPDSVVLVPTLVKGVNDSQIGDIIQYAADNIDIVRGVNVQPVAFTGRIDKSELEEKRITIPDFVKLVEEQTGGQISGADFYPVPSVNTISHLLSLWKNAPVPLLSCHPACGVATFVYIDKGRLVPVTRFIDFEGLLEMFDEISQEIANGGPLRKITAFEKFLKDILRIVDFQKMPKSSIMPKLLVNLFKHRNVDTLAAIFQHTLFLGSMHFQDLYNFDINRVQKCVIHYATPDGRVIPFCTYNTIHREEVERRFAKIPMTH